MNVVKQFFADLTHQFYSVVHQPAINGVPQPDVQVAVDFTQVDMLLRKGEHDADEIVRLKSVIAADKSLISHYEKIMPAALHIIFNMAPALGSLLRETMSSPVLTDDRTAVRLDSLNFAIVIAPFAQRITIRGTGNGSVVPEAHFAVTDGVMDIDEQTRLIGTIKRINDAASNGTDPVQGKMDLTGANAATVLA